MTKVTLSLHPECITSKDEADRKVGRITNELPSHVVNIEFEDFIEAVGCGCTWSGAIFEPKRKVAANWSLQQCFAIDVDNNDGDNAPPDLFIEHYTALGFPPNGMYHSLSSTRKKRKFRIIWAVDEPITDPIVAENFKRWLIMNSEGYADSCTINLDRLYYGGKYSEVLSEDFIPLAMVPQLEKKKKRRRKNEKRRKTGIDFNELSLAADFARKHMADPSKKYLTRYKTIFNCASYLVKATNGVWDGEKVYKFLASIMDNNPQVWADYHHSEDEIYEWCERAWEWSMENIVDG